MRKLRTIALHLLISFGLLAPLAVPVAVSAAPDADAALQCGADLKLQTTGCDAGATAGTEVNNVIDTVVNILSIVVGIVAVIMIIIAGFRYITSNGDSGAVSGAKNTIIYALVGLVVVALAQVIVKFVVNRITTTP